MPIIQDQDDMKVRIRTDSYDNRIRVKADPTTTIINFTGNTYVTGYTNVGSGVGVFDGFNLNYDVELRSISGGTGIDVVRSGQTIVIHNTQIPISDYITEAEFNLYTGATENVLNAIEDDIDYISGITGSKLSTSTFNSYSATTLTNINSRLLKTDFNSYSGATATVISNKLNTSIFNGYTASTASILTGLDNDINYLSGQTANKLNTSIFNSYTGITDPILDAAITGITVGTSLAVSQTGRVVNITFTGSTGGISGVTYAEFNTYTGVTAPATYVNKSLFNSYSGATLTNINSRVLNTTFNSYTGATSIALGTKVDDSTFNTYTGATATELSNINSELDLAITGATAGANLSVSKTGRVIDIQFTGNTSSGFNPSGETKVDLGKSLSGNRDIRYSFFTNDIDDATDYGTSTIIRPNALNQPLHFYNKGIGGFSFTNSTGLTGNYLDFNGSGLRVLGGNQRITGFTSTIQNDSVTVPVGSAIVSGLGAKLNTSIFNSYTGSTETRLDGIEDDISYLSGQTANKVSISHFNSYTGATNTRIGVIEGLYLTGTTNLGTGQAILGVSGKNVTGKSLKVGTNLGISSTANDITITFTGSTSGGSGTITGATNVGSSGEGVFKSVSGSNLEFKKITVGSNLAVSGGTNNVHITFTGSTGGGSGLPLDASIVTLTGNTTLDSTYSGKIIQCSGTFTVTLPNSMNTGMQVTIVNISTGIITIAASGTLQSLDSKNKIKFQYASATAYHAGSNVWRLFGNLQL